VEELEGLLHALVVDRRLAVGLDEAAACRRLVDELPTTGVVLRHRCVAGLAGLRGDGLRGLADLFPRGGRGVRVESGLFEQRAVVVQTGGVRLAREAEDVAISVLDAAQDDGVELVEVAEVLGLLRDVGELPVLEQRLAVGEGDHEDIGQAAGGELRGEGRAGPVVLDTDDVDVGVLLLELRLLCGERLVRRGVGAGREGRNTEFGLAGAAAPARATRGERGDHRDRRDDRKHLGR
jgi:hypothetical protein